MIGETAEDKAVFRQPRHWPGNGSPDHTLAVIGLIVCRHVKRFWLIHRRQFGRYDEGVAQQKIQLWHRHWPDETKISRLHRRRAPAKDAKAGSRRQPVQVNQNIDLIGANGPGRGLIRHFLDNGKMVEGGDHALPYLAAIIGARAVAVDLKP